MSKKLSFILEAIDRTTSTFSKISGGFDKVSNSAKKTQQAITLLPNSIGGLERKLDVLKNKQKNAFTVEGIKHYQKEINATEKQLNRLNSNKFSGLQKLGSQIGSQVPGLGGIATAITSPVAIATAGVAVIGKTLYNATDKAMQFEAGMAKVNGTLQLSPDKLKTVREELMSIGKNSTTALNEVPEAFYKIVSATGGDLPVSMDIMKKSLQGAEAGFTDVNSVADATVNIVNAVGKQNTNATKVMDVLFATLNKGKVEFTDIANYLPKIIPISKNLGASFQETSGTFAFLTANGLKAEATTTTLQNVFKAFGTEKIRDNFKKFGIQIFDSEGKMRSISAISKELGKSLDGLTDEQRTKKLESLGLDQEAALGMSIMSSNAAELGKNIDYVTNSGGELQRTLDASGNPLNTLKKLSNQFSGLMTEIGYKILPYVNDALEKALGWVRGIFDGITGAYEKSELFRDAIGGLETVFSKLWEGATLYFSSFGDSFDKANEELKKHGTSWEDLGNRIDKVYSWHKTQVIGFASGAMAVFKLLKKAWHDLWSGNADALKSLSFEKIQSTFNEGYSQKIKGIAESNKKTIDIIVPPGGPDKKVITEPDKKTNLNLGGSGKSKKELSEGIDSVVGGGKQMRNITINVTKLVESLTISTQNLKEGVNDMQRIVEEALLRVLNSANSLSDA